MTNDDPRITELVSTFCRLIYLAGQLGSPEEPAPEIEHFDRAGAANYCTIGKSTFDRCKRAGWIKPSHTIGKRGHRYAEHDLIKLKERLKKESPPNGFASP